jgi:hypothetical protein
VPGDLKAWIQANWRTEFGELMRTHRDFDAHRKMPLIRPKRKILWILSVTSPKSFYIILFGRKDSIKSKMVCCLWYKISSHFFKIMAFRIDSRDRP